MLTLASCQKISSNEVQKQSLNQCKKECVLKLEFCQKYCWDNCPLCSVEVEQNAIRDYARYVHQRKVEGKKIMRELNSYRDPLKCRKVSCDCMINFATCNKGCTGVIFQEKLHHCV